MEAVLLHKYEDPNMPSQSLSPRPPNAYNSLLNLIASPSCHSRHSTARITAKRSQEVNLHFLWKTFKRLAMEGYANIVLKRYVQETARQMQIVHVTCTTQYLEHP